MWDLRVTEQLPDHREARVRGRHSRSVSVVQAIW